MYILKNALKNLIRNRGRNILLGIIMTAILSCTAVSIIINTTSNKIIKDYKNRFGAEVFIQSNMEKTQEKIDKGEYDEINKGVPSDVKENISKSKYLKETIFSLGFSGYSDKIKSLDQNEYEDDNLDLNVIAIGPNGKKNITKKPNLNILGGLSNEGNNEFKNGTRKIIEGKMPQKNNEAIVSEKFAKLNNLKVGDDLQIKNPQDPDKLDSLDLYISGIYYDGSESNSYGITHPMLNRSNEIIATVETLKLYNQKYKDSVSMDAKYYLKDPDMLEDFNKDAHKLGLSDLYDVSVDAGSYNTIVKPVEGLKSISKIFMTLVLLFGGSVLVLISILAIRERKYEIGVLRAMGMKKWKVTLGLIFETLSLIVISLSIGLSIGSISAQPISNMLLQGQIEAQKSSLSSMTMMVGIGPSATVAGLEKLDLFLSSEAILIITLIALLLGVVSVSIGILYINRYEPRKILTERN